MYYNNYNKYENQCSVANKNLTILRLTEYLLRFASPKLT